MAEDKQRPLVSIVCLAYNHAGYIRQCLDGFVMQKTDFSYEIIIHDDASTDGTAQIIREYVAEYPELFVPIYQTTNQYSQGIPIGKTFMYPLAKGRYIAECEGDDYWTDPYKLQKQVDFLESHPEYVLVCTDCDMLTEKTGEISRWILGTKDDIDSEYLMQENRIATLTTMYRKDILNDYLGKIFPIMPKFMMGDYPQWLYFVSRGKIRKLPQITSMYRNRNNSESHQTDKFKSIKFLMSSYDIRVWCNEQFEFNVKGIRKKEIKGILKMCRTLYGFKEFVYWPLFFKCLAYYIYLYLIKKDFVK